MSCAQVVPSEGYEALRLGLMDAGLRLRGAVEDPARFDEARRALVQHCYDHVIPQLERDEARLVGARDCPSAAPLVEAVMAETRAMAAAVLELDSTEAACEAVSAVRVLHTLLALRAGHEKRLAAVLAAQPA